MIITKITNWILVIQLSMDGPNVNPKLFRIFREYLLKNNCESKLLCPIHIVHGGFKTGHNKVKWNINDFLRKSYLLFKDFPSRRANYIKYGGSLKLPLKFCTIRWLENVPALRRGLEILKPLKLYFEKCKKVPQSQNYGYLKKMMISLMQKWRSSCCLLRLNLNLFYCVFSQMIQ